MLIQTTMRYYCIPIRMVSIWTIDGIWCSRNSHPMQSGTATLEEDFAVSYKTKPTLTI